MSEPTVIAPSTWSCLRPDTFADTVALVTGAAGGMGSRIVQAFADLGATVIATDADQAAVDRLADQVGASVHPRRMDVTSRASVTEVVTEAEQSFGRLDHVVTCAAIITATPFAAITDADWHRVFDINAYGTFVVAQQALAIMRQQSAGHLVIVGSDAGKQGGGGLVADAAYAASKAVTLSLTKSLAREYSGCGISINALTPGPTDTPLHQGLPSEVKDRIAAGLPIRRMGHPDDMAAAVMFLCSPAARFVYGASLNVDGGSLFE
ncbi:MAG: SDR family NAD(P)-dependent oxidoreductase [Propioniciclava sp.]